MSNQWGPSWWGRCLTGAPAWSLIQNGQDLSLIINDQTYSISIKSENSYHVASSLFWTSIMLNDGDSKTLKVGGLPNGQSKSLISALDDILLKIVTQEKIKFLQGEHQRVSEWIQLNTEWELDARNRHWWLTHEVQDEIEKARPKINDREFRKYIKDNEVQKMLGSEALASLKWSLTVWEMDHRLFWAAMNACHTEHELEACKHIFEKVESKPLTREQGLAVICFDSRVQVVASAGSGKTINDGGKGCICHTQELCATRSYRSIGI